MNVRVKGGVTKELETGAKQGHEPKNAGSLQKLGEARKQLPQSLQKELPLLTPSF